MKFVSQIGNRNSISITSNHVLINGNVYNIPEHVKRKHGTNTSIVNGKCYINGYEVTEEGTFKRTIAALFHWLF